MSNQNIIPNEKKEYPEKFKPQISTKYSAVPRVKKGNHLTASFFL